MKVEWGKITYPTFHSLEMIDNCTNFDTPRVCSSYGLKRAGVTEQDDTPS